MSSLTITLIQTKLFWEDRQANLSMLSEKIDSIKEQTELVVLPEMFTTGFSMRPHALAETMDGDAVAWMKETARNKRVILTGSLIIKEHDRYFNRLIWMLPNGTYGFYDKRHLFAFAGEDKFYQPGSRRLIASVKGWRVNLQVCYDLRFPVWARQQQMLVEEADKCEYDLLLYVANWPERRKNAWITLLQARAIENQCFVAGVNRVGEDGNDIYHSGNSMVVSPLGEVLYTKEHQEDIFTVTLQKNVLDETRSRFPFWKDADYFTILNDK
ncbi:amidohydrolase [Panacibacter sp. DH6]|uniref:Omega-amidase YafV n=1 Tax=Panacibacter microcysteis TaxID=2793269 RepID=A0A931GUJ7_9BACT|nr:amidohydrolase [Panacibacter microcysteis]MBG9375430.1 amidohydrolase [Panacibacter microcysteis]